MIPYYNALIVPYHSNQILVSPNNCKVLEAFLAQTLAQTKKYKSATICIHEPQRQSSQLKTQMRMIIEKLDIGLFRVNDTYTLNPQIQMMYTGLSQVLVVEGQSKKGPARLQNLQLLSQYFQKYKHQSQMKEFLKNLLIEELSHEKKSIKYRTQQEISAIIRVMIANLTGQINLSITNQPFHHQYPQEVAVEIVLLDTDKLRQLSLQSIVRFLNDSFRIQHTSISPLTQTMTINPLVKRAQDKIQQVAAKYNLVANQTKKQVKTFIQALRIVAALKAILTQGLRLVSEQKALKEAFLQFVNEMTIKNSNQISRYIKGFQSQVSFKAYKTLFQLKQAHTSTIFTFLKTSLQLQSYNKHKSLWKNKNCMMIQNHIRSCLIYRRQKYQYFQSFMEQQLKQREAMAEYYSKLIQYYNHTQIKKLKQHNKFKYGFSCCTFILELKNHSNYRCFDPNNILNLIQRTNKSQDLISTISCNRNFLQLVNLQGKKYRLGISTVFCQRRSQENNKQNSNTVSNSNSYYHSAKAFSSLCKQSRNMLKSTRYSCDQNSYKTKSRQKVIEITDEDYEFLIDECGYLYGRGKNQLGQLGLGPTLEITQYTLIFRYQKIKYVASANKHTVAVTTDNKLYYFGRQKGDLPSSKIPQQLPLSLGVIKQVICSIDNTYFLTENNRIYSLQSQNYIRIPKEMAHSFDNLAIIRTGTYNLQIVYVVAYWTNSLDPTQRNEIAKFLTNYTIRLQKQHPDSILVENTFEYQTGKGKNCIAITQLSAILQEPEF